MSHPTSEIMQQRQVAAAEAQGGEWRNSAACKDHEMALFFPEPSPGRVTDYEPALALCRECEFVGPCRRQAEADGDIVDGYTTHGQVVGGCAPKVRKSYYRVQPHGTLAAYRRHERSGEVPCRSCAAAKAEYNRERWAKRAAS